MMRAHGWVRPPRHARTAAQQAGDAAESLVLDRLLAAGWTVLARNVHVGRHELDLVAVDPGPPPALVIVEVRWRASRGFGLAEETVDHRKRARVRRAAFGLLDRACCRTARRCRAFRSGSTSSSSSRAITRELRPPIAFDATDRAAALRDRRADLTVAADGRQRSRPSIGPDRRMP